MPSLGLHLQLQYLPSIGTNTSGGKLPATRLADYGRINVNGNNGSFPLTYLADTGLINISSFNSTAKVKAFSDTGLISISAFNGGSTGVDNGLINLSGNNANGKVGIKADTGSINISGNDATKKLGIKSDTGNINLNGNDGTVKISIIADYGGINSNGIDADWEEDFVANYVENVVVSANTQSSPAFSIGGKLIYIKVPITSSPRLCTLQTLAADGTTWISTDISWTTSSSVNGIINSETLAKISGETGIGLNNFRLTYDVSLTATTTHIVRSRT